MDRIINQISISTSLIIAKFLSKNIHSILSPLDTCLLSTIIICLTYVFGQKHQMALLSRKLAVLLIVQTIQPLLTRVISADVHIQSIIINIGIISILSVIPFNVSDELESLITATSYLYSNTLNFLVLWRREHLSVLITLLVVFRLNNHYMPYPRLQQIIAISIMSTATEIIQDTDDTLVDARILRFSLFLIVLHVVTTNTAHEVEDTILYSYVGFVQNVLPQQPFTTTIITFLLSLVCKHCIGVTAWPTRACILVCSNVFVQSVLQYVQQLAVFDTIVTLKTSALVLQFLMQIAAKISFTEIDI